MSLELDLEETILWATLIIAFAGGMISLGVRILLDSRHQKLGPILFFSAMLLVSGVTIAALGCGSHCWISGGGALLFMCLVGTISPSERPAAVI